MNTPQCGDHDIAIIGMAGCFPGSATIVELWEHLVAGRDMIARFTANQASTSPMLPRLTEHPRFIGAEGVLAATRTDPSLLHLRPHEVAMLDTQSALFLDCVLAAFEDAGYDPFDAPGRVALYGAASVMPMVEDLLRRDGKEMHGFDLFSRATNMPDALPMRAAHLFGFRGEAIAVNTACSSGLVVAHMACQSLLIGSSDLAVAIAVSVPGVQKTGYAYDEGFIGSRDGVVRPFDAAASGAVQGHGVGAVLLKPCSDALRDRDRIYAVIRGSAINNDGREKVGFTAPSVTGQAAVIAEAQALAGITADQVGYVETHGTATKLGDPVEVAGLTRAFRETTIKTGFCQLGAVKANIGHLDRAAGMVGLIKAALVVHHGTIPPLSHFRAPNPELDLDATPFTVTDKAVPWPGSRVAGVSSFGIGGTNAHVVLTQAPELYSAEATRTTLLVTLSAASETALDRAAHDLAAALESRPAVDVADSVYSCNTRRLHWPVRRAIVGADADSLVGALRSRSHSAPEPVHGAALRIAFVFAGMGSNPAGVGAHLYATEPLFRDHVDICDQVLHELGLDVRSALVDLPVDARLPVGQFAASLFVLETGLVRLLGSWGISPEFVIGHSLGEYAAAVSSGMLTLDQALHVVAVRCHAMDAMTTGAMLVAGCASDDAEALGARFGVEVAARNAPEVTVFSGPPQAISVLRAELLSRRALAIPLGVDRALHSRDVDPVLPRILEAFSIPLAPPAKTFVSTVTGAIETQRVLRPEYWTEQMRRPVLFSSALIAARQAGANVFVEIGPSGGLVPLVVRNFDKQVRAFPSLTGQPDARSLYALLGGLWELGAAIDWRAFYAAEQRQRVSIPIHPRPDALPEDTTPAHELPHRGMPDVDQSANSSTADSQLEMAGQSEDTQSIEARVSSIWRTALAIETIDHGAHFFELGGTSLLAVQLVAKMSEAFNIDLQLADVFASPTVAAVSALVTSKLGAVRSSPVAQSRADVSAAPSHRPAAAKLARPGASNADVLSAVQRRALAADSDPALGPNAVNLDVAVRIRGRLDDRRLAKALHTIVRRHEALHTKFHVRGQSVDVDTTFRSSDVTLTSVWLDAVSESERLAEARAAMIARVAQRFDLSREIPLRAFLFRLGEDDHVLFMIVHHVAADAPSVLLVTQQLLLAAAGVDIPGDAPAYSVFAGVQADEIAAAAEDVRYWQDLIARSPRLQAMIGSDDAARADTHVRFGLSGSLVNAIVELRRRHKVSTFVVIVSGLALALRELIGRTEFIIGTPYGNRDRPEHGGLVGYVAHCMLMTVDLQSSTSFPRVLVEVQRAVQEALRHVRVPFEHSVSHSPDARPFCDFEVVVHENLPSASQRVGDLDVEPFEVLGRDELHSPRWSAAMGSLGVLVALSGDGGGTMTFDFPRALLGDDGGRAVRERLEGVLLAALSDQDMAVPASARVEVPRSPLAVRLDGVVLSHAELRARSAQVSAMLGSRGIASSSRVHVAARNRAELICVAHAVLSAGASITFEDDAPFVVAFEGSDPRAILVSFDGPRGTSHELHCDPSGGLVTPDTLRAAAEALAELSPSERTHLVWGDQLAADRVLALALVVLGEGGLVSEFRAMEASQRATSRRMPLGLAYFPVDVGESTPATYHLFLEGARRADAMGLEAVWTPERHFDAFGGLFPDPLVAAAALAHTTRTIRLRAGSLVLPLHDPVRVAESWAMVDVMSGGRVGLALATGWRAEDFVLAPNMFATRRDVLVSHLATLRSLWRGEPIERAGPDGRRAQIRSRPRPLQPEIPIWLPTSGAPETLDLAAELGAGLLMMVTDSIASLSGSIARYRRAFAERWSGGHGHVAVMIHTYVHRNRSIARELARPALERYVEASLVGLDMSLTSAAKAQLARTKAERLLDSDALIGDFADCRERLAAFHAAGVDEIACLVDFGVDHELALEAIDGIGALKDEAPIRPARWSRLPPTAPLEHRDAFEVFVLDAAQARSFADAPHRALLLDGIAAASQLDREQPLVGLQLGLFLNELRFTRPLYNNPTLSTIPASIDVERLIAALAAVCARHDMLRSRFLTRNGRVVKIVDEVPHPDISIVDEPLSDEQAVIGRARADARLSFDLARVHPLRARIYRCDDGSRYLLLLIHHIAGDAWSSAIVLRDLLASYAGQPIPAPPRTVTTTVPTSQARRASLRFWQELLADAPTTLEWPSAKTRPETSSGTGQLHIRALSAEQMIEVKNAARGAHTSLPGFLLAALQTLLHTGTGRRDLIVGTVVSGRNDPALFDVVAPLINVVPLRSRISDGLTFRALAAATNIAIAEAMRHGDVTFADIVRCSKVAVARDRSPLVQFVFNFLPPADSLNSEFHTFDIDWGVAEFDLVVTVAERAGAATLTFHYADDAFTEDEVRALADAYLRVVSCVGSQPDIVLRNGGDAVDYTQEALAAWVRDIADAPPLELPVDRRRSQHGLFAPRAVSFEIGHDHALRELAAANDGTVLTTLLAAFAVLLGHHGGSRDLVLACAVPDVERFALETIVGAATPFMPLRIRFDDDPSFGELVTRVTRSYRTASRFDALAVIGSHAAPSVLFSLSNSLDGATTSHRFDLHLDVVEARDGLRCVLRFDPALFDDASIDAIKDRLVRLIESVVLERHQRVTKLELLPDHERGRILGASSGPQRLRSADAAAHARFESQARECPNAVAVVARDRTLTYRELDERSNQLAHHLSRYGIGRGTRVAICLDRTSDMLVTMLGIWKCGAAYVPLDPDYPDDRVRFALHDARCSALVTERRFAPRFASDIEAGRLIHLDDCHAAPKEFRDHGAHGMEIAYVIYTSGSTGTPKGVAVSHRAVANFIDSVCERPGLSAEDALCAVTTLSFDIAVLELLAPVSVGATTVILSRETAQDPVALAAELVTHRATTFQATPATYRMLLDSGWSPRSPLRRLLVGGEALDVATGRGLTAGNSEVWNMYGPTETTVWSSCAPVPKDGPVTLGAPFANTTLHVVDSSLGLVPIGVAGELCIGGDGLAQGYWERAALTAEKFVPDPFSDRDGARMYRTGDLVRRTRSGDIEFLGRIDHQVKIRGFRIELAEIESVLRSHSCVDDVAVLVREGSPGHQQLVAYVVAAPVGSAAQASEQLESWQTLWRDVYAQDAPHDPAFNLAGWRSSYTDQPIPASEMRQWVDETVSWIAGAPLGRVLEIGVGSGLLLFRLAGDAESYCGVDFAEESLALVRDRLNTLGDCAGSVTLLRREASELDCIPDASFDTIIINSVAQYVPSQEHLRQVLAHAVRIVRDGGRVHVGDVRSLGLLRAFRLSVALHQAQPETTSSQLRARVDADVNAERELLVAPELFYALHESLPRVSGIEALWKRGDYDNELSRFRYDVTIHVGPRPRNEMATMELRYGDPVPAASSGLSDVLILTGAPNPRVSRFVSALELLDAGHEEVSRLRDVVTDDVCPLQIPPGYELRASRVSAAGEARCDLICARVGADLDWHSAALVSPRGSSSARHTNTPAFSWSNAELGNRLRQLLMSRLPNYMVPQAFVFVDSMPQTPNGKLDRKALQAIGVAPDEAVYVGPRNVLEEQLCAAFAEVLGVARIGIHDSFFELGGHSLLAARLANRLHRALGRDVPLRTLFQAPTVARLSEILGAPTIADERGNEPVLVPLNVRALSDRDDEVVVFLPSLGGEVTPYRELALHIEHRSVFALRSPLLEGAPAPADRSELVMGYASAIRRSFDGRDVCVVGWSAGGVLCHAVAAHLRRNASTVVTRVVLLDSSVLERRSDIASARIAAIHALTIAGATEWIEAAMSAPESELPSLICRGLGLSGGDGVAYAERYIRTFEVHSSLLAGYQPEPLDVPVSLLTCSDTPDLRWNALAPVRVAGNHFSLLSAEHAQSTAAALSRIIQPSSAGSSHRRFEVIAP